MTTTKSSRSGNRAALALLAFFVGTLLPTVAFAQDSASWNGGVGFWNNPANWSCVISGKSQPCVPTGGNISTSVTNGIVTLDVNASVLSLTIDSAGTTVVANGFSLATGQIEVGVNGTGTLTINSGGHVTASSVFLALTVGSSGTLNVSDQGSQLTSGSSLVVGSSGSGLMSVTGGGKVNDQFGSISNGFPESSGAVTISGPGSRWDNVIDVALGLFNQSTLTLEDGAGGSSGSGGLIIGVNPNGATASMILQGAGTTWDDSGGVVIQSNTNNVGSLTVQDGATLTSTSTVNMGQAGTLTISGGGRVANVGGTVQGNATVSGPGSQWSSSQAVSNGGSLSVQDGGTVTCDQLTNGRIVTIGDGGTLATTGTYIDQSGGLFLPSTTVLGSGTLKAATVSIQEGGTLAGTGTISGSTIIGSQTLGAGLLPGVNTTTPGTLTFTGGPLTIATAGGLREVLTPAGDGIISVRGPLSLGGFLFIEQSTNYDPPIGTTLNIMNATTVQGALTIINPIFSGGHKQWTLRFDPSGTNVALVAVSTAGPLRISTVGDDQTGDVLRPLSQPLIVRVTDQAGNPPNASVDITFEITQQPSKNQFAVFSPSNASTVTVTVPAGTTDAIASLVLGDSPGQYQVTATANCGAQQCAPNQVTFTETAACTLTHPSFTWTQSQSHSASNTFWGNNEYDHSYLFHQPANVVAPQISETGRLELREGSTHQQFITLSPAENNLIGLQDKLNQIVGIHAVVTPKTGKLSVYNTGCIRGSSCAPRADHVLALCDGSCRTPQDNRLTPKHLRTVGCALTTLAMAANYAGIDSINTVVPPANTAGSVANDPAGLNDFMSKTLVLPTLGGQFTDEGEVDWYYTTSALRLNSFTSPTLSFEPLAQHDTDALDNALCIQRLPVVAEVTHNSHPHFVLITGNNGSGETDGSQYTIADPAGDGTPRDLAFYANRFELRGFVKDPVDRSKLVIATNSFANIVVVDSSGRRTGLGATQGAVLNEIPNAFYFEDSIADDVGDENDEGVNRSVVISTPLAGTYQIIVTGALSGPSTTWITAYSQDGLPQLHTPLTGIAVPGSQLQLSVQYSPTTGSVSTVSTNATFDSTLADIANSASLDLVNKETARELSRIIERAKEEAGEGEVRETRRLLKAFKDVLEDHTPKRVNKISAAVLAQDADSLLQGLPKCDSDEEHDRCEVGR